MRGTLVVAAACAALAPATAHAFCGFYVGGADAKMFANATQVVMLRKGTRTVLSMQNAYQGPPEDFALVVPVPVVLKEENVKTLPRAVFDTVDVLGSPRLVEYWERDPCDFDMELIKPEGESIDARAYSTGGGGEPAPYDYGVTVEAQFAVGEYEIVILSATESTGLDRWLRDHDYTIPEAAEPLLRPYVEDGSKFFVARVDPTKVTFEDGQAVLSPLRFHYDSEDFTLPIRLGLANSAGTQDLIVNIIARDRYEVANYDNVFVPTNLEVTDEALTSFREFYAALFDRTVEVHPRAVVTEYAWQASSCDPCAGPPVTDADYATLGGDVLAAIPEEDDYHTYGMTLTRLHARYRTDDIKDDLVFRKAEPVSGGREVQNWEGKIETGAYPDELNAFQARYAIRHHWKGTLTCDDPEYGRWDGYPPSGDAPETGVAAKIAYAPRGKVELTALLAQDVPELGLTVGQPPRTTRRGCGCAAGNGASAAPLALTAVLLLLRRSGAGSPAPSRRRRRRRAS